MSIGPLGIRCGPTTLMQHSIRSCVTSGAKSCPDQRPCPRSPADLKLFAAMELNLRLMRERLADRGGQQQHGRPDPGTPSVPPPHPAVLPLSPPRDCVADCIRQLCWHVLCRAFLANIGRLCGGQGVLDARRRRWFVPRRLVGGRRVPTNLGRVVGGGWSAPPLNRVSQVELCSNRGAAAAVAAAAAAAAAVAAAVAAAAAAAAVASKGNGAAAELLPILPSWCARAVRGPNCPGRTEAGKLLAQEGVAVSLRVS